MRCRTAERLDLDRELGLLDASRVVELERHLATCPDCRARLAGQAGVVRALAGLREAGPPCVLDVRERVLAGIAKPLPIPVEAVPRRQLVAASVVALAGAVGVLALGLTDVFPRLAATWPAARATLAALASTLAPLGAACAALGVELVELLATLASALVQLAPLLDPLTPVAHAAAALAVVIMAATTTLVVRRDLRRPAVRPSTTPDRPGPATRPGPGGSFP